MKPFCNSIIGLAFAVFGLGLTGCQTHESVSPVGQGYEEVSHPFHVMFDEPPPPRVSFQHRNADGKTTLIWPSLYGSSEVFQGDIAIFVGDLADADPDQGTHPRLFAVQAPALPLDITDEVLWRWSKSAGRNFATTLNNFSVVTPGDENGQLTLHLEFFSDDKDWPDKADLSLGWNQVAEIMRAVKTRGVAEKDLRWHTPYIGEKF
jgi:hypothetical protein